VEKLCGLFLIEHSICLHLHDNQSFPSSGRAQRLKDTCWPGYRVREGWQPLRRTTASYLVASGEGSVQAQLDWRDWLRLADQVAKLAQPDIRAVIGDLE
jgi:hypothetical protein